MREGPVSVPSLSRVTFGVPRWSQCRGFVTRGFVSCDRSVRAATASPADEITQLHNLGFSHRPGPRVTSSNRYARDPRRGRPRLGATPVHAGTVADGNGGRHPALTTLLARSSSFTHDRHFRSERRLRACHPSFDDATAPRARRSRTLLTDLVTTISSLTDVTHGRYSWISSHISLSHSAPGPRRGARGRGRTRQPDIETTQRKHPEASSYADSLGPQV